MKVLVIGSGGREHALLWTLKKSPILTELYITPGRPAMGSLGVLVNINIQNSIDVTRFCKRENIELVIIGPEQPIIDGLADNLVAEGINVLLQVKQLQNSKHQNPLPREYVSNTAYQLPSTSVLLMRD